MRTTEEGSMSSKNKSWWWWSDCWSNKRTHTSTISNQVRNGAGENRIKKTTFATVAVNLPSVEHLSAQFAHKDTVLETDYPNQLHDKPYLCYQSNINKLQSVKDFFSLTVELTILRESLYLEQTKLWSYLQDQTTGLEMGHLKSAQKYFFNFTLSMQKQLEEFSRAYMPCCQKNKKWHTTDYFVASLMPWNHLEMDHQRWCLILKRLLLTLLKMFSKTWMLAVVFSTYLRTFGNTFKRMVYKTATCKTTSLHCTCEWLQSWHLYLRKMSLVASIYSVITLDWHWG